ncbi:pinin/SDK/memA/ protein conserved region, partial [Rhizoctonia solani]|uniref:Pinin/SDK/memA/ protein conserved region n=1 Tax=Rhizoctonia solani TaxID=456999 RepID=A0A8H7IIH9_9AGAM
MPSESNTPENVVSPVQQSIEIDSTPNGAGEANVASTAADEKMDTNDSQLKKRPRIDMATEPRKKGRSVFGMVLGTLKKAKDEDKARASTETAKRRAEVEERLARELTRRKDQVRMESESKKQRSKAHQREEDIALKDSMIRQRQSTLPALANFLLTTDNIPSDFTFDPSVVAEPGDTDTNMADATTKDGAAPRGKQLSQFLPLPPRSRNTPSGPSARVDGPPIYFLPAVLLPQQKAFLEKRQFETKRILAAEEEAWKVERQKGLEEIQILKQNAQEAQEAARVAHKAEEGAEKPTENDGEPALNTSGENESKMEGVEGER